MFKVDDQLVHFTTEVIFLNLYPLITHTFTLECSPPSPKTELCLKSCGSKDAQIYSSDLLDIRATSHRH